MKSYRLEARKASGEIINRGTAWVIDRNIVATAFHVVSDALKSRWLHEFADVSYWLICDDTGTKIGLEPVNCDSRADVALLRVSPDLTGAKRPPLQILPVCEWGASVGTSWSAPSYPEIADAALVTLTGKIKSIRHERGNHVLELQVSEGGSVSWAGASGSPVFSNGRVIGLLLTELPDAATQDAASVQSALALLRLAQSEEFRTGLQDLVANITPAQLETLAADLPQDIDFGDKLALADMIADHAWLHGVHGIMNVVEHLSDTPKKQTYKLGLLTSTFDLERVEWPRAPLRDNGNWDRHAGCPIPQSLEKAWTMFMPVSWHTDLRRMVEQLTSSLETIRLRRGLFGHLQNLDFQAPFPELCDELLTLIDQIEADIGNRGDGQSESNARHAIVRIERHIHPTTPRGMCFFLMGSSGSGKTHFLEWLMKRRHPSEWVLPVAWPNAVMLTTSSLEKEIVAALLKATGRPFATLAEFQESLDGFAIAREYAYSTYSLDPTPQPPRLVIAFDDMQNVLSDVNSRAAACGALQGLIKTATSHCSIRWLVTLQDTFFDRLAMPVEPPSFWEEYGFLFNDIDSLPPAATVPAKGGWLDLDRMCVQDGVGQAILSSGFGEDWHTAVAIDSKLGPARLRTGALRRYIALPWFAWILASMGEQWCIDALQSGDLNHIRIVDELHKKKVRPLGDSESSRMNLGRYLRATAAALLPGDGSRLNDHHFHNDSEERCREAKTLFVANDFRDALERFITSGLLKRRDGHQVRLDAEFVMLWGYEAAKYLELVLTGKNSATIAARLCAELATNENDLLMLKESVLEFFLMLADSESGYATFDALLGQTLSGLGRNAAAILFAAPKLSPDTQQHIAQFDVQSRATVSTEGPDRRLLLAAMMFAEWADSTAFTPAERLDFVRAHYRTIGAFGFSSYYRAVAFDILDEVTDIDALRACMVSLNGCEQAGLAKDMAIRVVDTMFDIVRERMPVIDGCRAVIDTVVQYALESAASAKEDYRQRQAPGSHKPVQPAPRNGPGTSWRRDFFREWVLHEVCTRLVDELAPVPAFEAMNQGGWFDEGGRGDLHIEMEREATLAMGHYFHGAPRLLRGAGRQAGADFIELVDKLAGQGSEQRMLAFNMIVHTKPTGGHYNQKISDAFIPLLEFLAKDPKVASKKRFRGVYKSTVGRELRIAFKPRKSRNYK
jgi:hypothetical protein